jgi:hypothetical protein
LSGKQSYKKNARDVTPLRSANHRGRAHDFNANVHKGIYLADCTGSNKSRFSREKTHFFWGIGQLGRLNDENAGNGRSKAQKLQKNVLREHRKRQRSRSGEGFVVFVALLLQGGVFLGGNRIAS